jgi:hypothetical protein
MLLPTIETFPFPHSEQINFIINNENVTIVIHRWWILKAMHSMLCCFSNLSISDLKNPMGIKKRWRCVSVCNTTISWLKRSNFHLFGVNSFFSGFSKFVDVIFRFLSVIERRKKRRFLSYKYNIK